MSGVRYDATKFNYLARATSNVPVHMVLHTAPATSIDGLKRHEVITGAVGTGGTHNDLPRAQNALIGTNVPSIVEITENEEAKSVFNFLVSSSTVGRAYAAPPGVPAETVAILRKAFTDMLNDPTFRADAQKRGADLMPMPGAKLAAYVSEIVATSPNIVRKTNEAIAAR